MKDITLTIKETLLIILLVAMGMAIIIAGYDNMLISITSLVIIWRAFSSVHDLLISKKIEELEELLIDKEA